MEDRPIGDYGIIGDCRTAALIGSNGSIDWCCLPEFDSPAVFCRLLDVGKGGRFQIEPAGDYQPQRAYLESTNVLATTFRTADGEARLTDFMPCPDPEARQSAPRIFRCLEGIAGSLRIVLRFEPTFDYARDVAKWSPAEDGVLASCRDERLHLTGVPSDLAAVDGKVTFEFDIEEGEKRWFVLGHEPKESKTYRAPTNAECERALDACGQFWRNWVGNIDEALPSAEEVRRGALTLRLLFYEPTGSFVAAPTTSLPEIVGGSENWDYRFTWLRDSALILDVLQMLGHHKESIRFFRWLQELCLCGEKAVQPIYRLDGRAELPESSLDHLSGYRNSHPVRIGNDAAKQDQLDIYGHILDAFWLCHSRMPREVNDEMWEILRRLTNLAVERWQEPDHGLWELRGEKRHYLYSKLYCWVAVDRALRLAKKIDHDPDLEKWQRAREAIRQAILERGYNENVGAFTQSFDSDVLDAAVLVMPSVGFLPSTDERMISTVDRICDHLMQEGWVWRYRRDDSRPAKEEGAFAMCSFWLVQNLARQGRTKDARELFDRLSKQSNDLGLFAEEFDPSTGELLGNFPQGYTHLAFIRASVTLNRAEKRLARTH